MKSTLLKRSSDGIWQKRFCETDGVFLTIYRSKSADKIIQIICMPQASNIKLIEFLKHDDDSGYAFDIIMPDGKSVNFKAQSLKDASQWVDVLLDMIKLPMPTSLPTTPIEDIMKTEENKENFTDNNMKKRVTFDLQSNDTKRALSPTDLNTVTVANHMHTDEVKLSMVKATSLTLSIPNKPYKMSDKSGSKQQLLSREDLSLNFYFKRDKQMILTHILSLYPASPCFSAAPSNLFSSFPVAIKKEQPIESISSYPITSSATSTSPSIIPVATTHKVQSPLPKVLSWAWYLMIFTTVLAIIISSMYFYPMLMQASIEPRSGYFGKNAKKIVMSPPYTHPSPSDTLHQEPTIKVTLQTNDTVYDDAVHIQKHDGSMDVVEEVDLDHPAFGVNDRISSQKDINKKDKKVAKMKPSGSIFSRMHHIERFDIGRVVTKTVLMPFKLALFALRFFFHRVDALFSRFLT